MIDFITDKFTDIVLKCIKKNADITGVDKKEVQILFRLDESENIEYVIMNNYKQNNILTFLQVLGFKVDLKGYSLFVPKFIKGSLIRLSNDYKIDKDKVSVMVCDNGNGGIYMWLYNGNAHVKNIDLEYFINSDDIIS